MNAYAPVAGDELAAGLLDDLRGEGAGVADVAQELWNGGGCGVGGWKGVLGVGGVGVMWEVGRGVFVDVG